jgi:RHS repeat-associated protein
LNLCAGPNCHSEIKAVIWDGNQDLYELRADGEGQNGPTDGGMDAYDATPSNPSTAQFYGRAGYTIGATLDLPLAIEHPTGLVAQYFIPHPNWHGLFDQGTNKQGTLISCDPACIDWPAVPNALDYSLLARQEANLDSWSGDLVNQSRDMSGQMYMRNRYYDPATGRFTQEDPIGLAGGLNAYGFAAGDVVNYSDPFGLCIEDACIAEALLAAAALAAENPAVEEEMSEASETLAGIGDAVASKTDEVVEETGSLVRNLANSGEVKQVGEAAHHIVAKAAKAAAPARAVLEKFGVGINSAANGVNLPAVRGAVSQAVNHLTLHTSEYFRNVNDLITQAASRSEVLQTLGHINDQLLNGSFPH